MFMSNIDLQIEFSYIFFVQFCYHGTGSIFFQGSCTVLCCRPTAWFAEFAMSFGASHRGACLCCMLQFRQLESFVIQQGSIS